MIHLRAIGVVIILLALIAFPFLKYWTYLTKGMSPPASTKMLDRMESAGVPEFNLETLIGGRVSLSQYAGRIVVINFWASWCAPCVKEFPSLRRLVDKMNGKITVLAISADTSRADLDSFLKVFGVLPRDFVVLWDKEKRVQDLYGTDMLPESYIVGKDRRLIRKVAGIDEWDAPMALQFFEELVR